MSESLDDLVIEARQDNRDSARMAFAQAKQIALNDTDFAPLALEMFVAAHGPLEILHFEDIASVRHELLGAPGEDGTPGLAVFSSVQAMGKVILPLLKENALLIYGNEPNQMVDIPARIGQEADKKKRVPPPSEGREEQAEAVRYSEDTEDEEIRIEGFAAVAAAFATVGGLGYLVKRWWESRPSTPRKRKKKKRSRKA